MSQKKSLILVDGSSYLYRAFHAMPALMNSKNFPTGAVYGVTNMLKRLLTQYQPEYIAVIFDTKGKTFRDELYADYKATRKEMPDDLSRQIEPIHNIIRAMGLPLVAVEGVEADDVIGTLAHHATQAGINTLVSTGDKDMAQLVNQQVTLVNTMTDTIMDPAGVKEKFGVTPEQIIDYLTLVGDTSDNIPGVPQVGPKTAAKWLSEYGLLQNIVKNADKITGKVGENLRTSIENLPLTKELVTIKLDVKLPVEFDELVLKPADNKRLIELFGEMEFKSWLSELLKKSDNARSDKYQAHDIIFTENEFEKWLSQLQKAKQFAFDTETTTAIFSCCCCGCCCC
jgi:DNA polymerase-1